VSLFRRRSTMRPATIPMSLPHGHRAKYAVIPFASERLDHRAADVSAPDMPRECPRTRANSVGLAEGMNDRSGRIPREESTPYGIDRPLGVLCVPDAYSFFSYGSPVTISSITPR
jgi:hypothetical protein